MLQFKVAESRRCYLRDEVRWLPSDLGRGAIVSIIIRVDQVTARERDPNRAAFDIQTQLMIIVSVSEVADRERADGELCAIGLFKRDAVKIRQT